MSDDETRRKREKPGPLSKQTVATLAKTLFNIVIDIETVKELDSYDDRNFYIRVDDQNDQDDQKEYTFKVHNGVESDRPSELDAQNQLLLHLQANGITCCSPVAAVDGTFVGYSTLKLKDGSDKKHAIRLLVWVPGSILHDVTITSALIASAGAYLGKLNKALRGFDHPGAHRTHSWDLKNSLFIRDFVKYIDTEEKRLLIGGVLDEFEALVLPDIQSDKLPRSIIMGDFNDANIIVTGNGGHQTVSGVIDFGDMVYTLSVIEIAVAIAYMMVNVATSLRAEATTQNIPAVDISDAMTRVLDIGKVFFAGFCTSQTLTATEIEVLPTLIACRLAMSTTLGAFSIAQDPGNEYLKLHSEPGWIALRLLRKASTEEKQSMFKTSEEEPPKKRQRMEKETSPRIVYRLATQVDYDQASTSSDKTYMGGRLDDEHGFIHLSTLEQAQKTASIYFKQQTDTVLLSVDTSVLLAPTYEVKWEEVPTRANELFPHLFHSGKGLPLSAVLRVTPLPLGPEGHPVLPDKLE